MKRYEFSSQLSPERVRARLRVLARPMKFGWAWEEHQVFCKLLPDGRFCLLKTGGAWQMKPQLPFAGELTASETGCRLSGGFGPTAAMRNTVLGAMAAAFLLGLSFTGVSVYAVTVLTVCVLLWGGLGWLVLTKLTPLFGCRSWEETLAFIRENLLIE